MKSRIGTVMGRSRHYMPLIYVVVVCAVHFTFSVHSFVMSQPLLYNCQNMTGVVDCSIGSLLVSENISYPINITCSVCCENNKCCQHNGTIGLKVAKLNVSHHHQLVLGIFTAGFQSCSDMNSTESLITQSVIGFNGSHNNLLEVPWFSQWPYLQWIDLSNNNINKLLIPLNFGNESALETLILRNNEIHATHPHVFNQLHNLKYLFLSDNPSIVDWLFLNSADITLVEYNGRNKLSGSDSNLFQNCPSDTTVILDEDVIISLNFPGNSSHRCVFAPVWPAETPKMSPIELCRGKDGLQSPSTKTTTMVVLYSEDIYTASQNLVSNGICSNFKILSLDFLSSGLNCIWGIIIITIATILVVLTVLLFVRWRLKVRHEGRYSRWIAVYNQHKSSSSNEHEFDIKHGHCNQESYSNLGDNLNIMTNT